jgi:hypothetical protein
MSAESSIRPIQSLAPGKPVGVGLLAARARLSGPPSASSNGATVASSIWLAMCALKLAGS